jgi:hypothetical protein
MTHRPLLKIRIPNRQPNFFYISGDSNRPAPFMDRLNTNLTRMGNRIRAADFRKEDVVPFLGTSGSAGAAPLVGYTSGPMVGRATSF